ncbi:MAG: CsgG/HfaB family protein [Chthoniobacteraceae bacterium]
MRHVLSSLIAVAVCLTSGFAEQQSAPPEAPITIAVFDFQSPEEAVRDLGPKVSTLIAAQLSTDARLITVERAELDKALGEQELALSGTVSAESAAKVGNLTGAQALVTGRIIRSGGETLIVAKVIGTDTSRVFGLKSTLAEGGALSSVADDLARQIGDVAAKNRNALIAKPEPADARLQRIQAALQKGAKRPSVLVKIPEEHLSRRVIDPAAETELAKLLQECGFTVFDEKTPGRAEYAIEGEAFSERAAQRGNLVSCKARVEVKLRNVATGVIVSSDRQVSVATDLGEHVAAKSALSLAAAEIAERLLPRIR